MAELGRDLGDATWLVAAGAFALWAVLVGLVAWRVAPRRVHAGPDAIDLVGDEPPALVNLLTGSWSLGREAVPVTLLDLAARGHLSIRQAGELTVVHVPGGAGAGSDGELRPYEEMVLARLRRLADGVDERVVPAPALTTGVRREARAWWRRFRTAVHADAMERGLARRRWPGGLKLLVAVAGAGPGLAFGLALAHAVVDGASVPADDFTPAALTYGGAAFVGLAVAVGALLRGVTDTPSGREVAARWLGLRTTLGRDPRFSDQTPAAVEVWGRTLAHAAAMGLAPEALTDLWMGAESRRRMWSPVGGTWRPIRIRYPRMVIGYGLHPAAMLAIHLLFAGMFVVPVATMVGGSGDWVLLPLLVPLVPVLTFTVPTAVRAALDLVKPRRVVEGRVLRVEERRHSKSTSWYVVVDDGTTHQVRPWLLHREPPFGLDAVVRAEVSPHLGHVRNLEVVAAGETSVASTAELGWADAPTPTDHPTSRQPGVDRVVRSVGRRAGRSARSAPDVPGFPDTDEVREVVGTVVGFDPSMEVRSVEQSGHSTAYVVGNGHIMVTWISRRLFERTGCGGRFLTRPVDGVGEVAYRSRLGGSVQARRGDVAIVVACALPGVPRHDRDRVSAALANHCLQRATQAQSPSGREPRTA